MDFEAVCRTCLGTKSLSPIFKRNEYYEELSLAIMNIAGLKVKMFDGLPQNMCVDCMEHINKSLKFRAECKKVEKKLLELYNLENTVRNEIIENEEEKNRVFIEEKSQELFTDIKTEEVSSGDDDKPLIDLFDETENLKNNNLEANTNTDSKIPKIIITENIILNSPMFKEKTNSNKCEINNRILNNLKTENSESQTKNKKVTCGICQKHLSIRSVDVHMSKRHPGADIRKIKCEFCDTYILKMKMNRHLTMIHGKHNSICGYCKLEFRTKEMLLEHVSMCTAKKRKWSAKDTSKVMSECDICHKKMQKASLKMHQRVKHAGLGPICDHCGRKFGNKFRLNEHLRSKHGYEKYKCGQCDFQSAGTMAMRNHERRHRGEKPYVCEECGHGFHAAYLLAQHAQSHRTTKLKKCDLCPASFKANNSLHTHKRACHSNTTYKCTLCERGYRCRQYVVKHLRSVHGYSGPVPSLEQKSK